MINQSGTFNDTIKWLWPLRFDPFKRYMLRQMIRYERIRRDRGFYD